MPNNSDEVSNSTEMKAVAGRVGHNSKEAKAANRREETETQA